MRSDRTNNMGWEDVETFPAPEVVDCPFHLQLMGVTYGHPGYRISRARSSISVFEQVIQGRGYLEIGGTRYALEAGDVYVVPKGSTHCYGSDPKDPYEKLWFNVMGPLPLKLLETYNLEGVFVFKSVNMESLFRYWRRAILEDPSRSQAQAALAIHDIVQTLAAKTSLTPKHSPEALTLKRYIDQRADRKISVAELAELIHLSVSQTIRIFKREWGVTPRQYHLTRKLDRAAILLRNTMKPVKEIAYDLNFNDEYYFSNLFKRHTKLSPTAYRHETKPNN